MRAANRCLLVFAGTLLASSLACAAYAQVTVGCQNADLTPAPCRSGGGGGGDGGGGPRGPDVLDKMIDMLFPSETPAHRAKRLQFNAIVERANAAKHAGRWAETEAGYRELAALQPDAVIYHNVGYAILKQGRYDEAAVWFRKTVALDRKLGRAWLIYATSLQAAKLFDADQLDAAEAALREILKLDDKDQAAHANLGKVYRRRGDEKQAEAEFRLAIALDPKDDFARSELTDMLDDRARRLWDRSKDYGGAASAYRAAIEVRPADPYLHHMLSNALIEGGRLKEAEEAARQAMRLAPNNSTYVEDLGVIFERGRDPAAAEAAYRQATQLNPNDAHVWGNIGNLLERQDRLGEAKAAYQQILRIKPGDTAAQGALTRITTIEQDRAAKTAIKADVDRLAARLASQQASGGPSVQRNQAAAGGGALEFMTVASPSGDLRGAPADQKVASASCSGGNTALCQAQAAAGNSGQAKTAPKATAATIAAIPTVVRPPEGKPATGPGARDEHEGAKASAGCVFDGGAGCTAPPVTGDGVPIVPGPRYEVPKEFANLPEIKQLEAQRRQLEDRQAELAKQIQQTRAKRLATSDPKERGLLEVAETNFKSEQDKLPGEIRKIEIAEQEKVTYQIKLGQKAQKAPK
jgi:Flp pilus assembly protein TadD